MCQICYENYTDKDMHGLETCKHKFCPNCITDYLGKLYYFFIDSILEYNITNGQVKVIKCAD